MSYQWFHCEKLSKIDVSNITVLSYLGKKVLNIALSKLSNRYIGGGGTPSSKKLIGFAPVPWIHLAEAGIRPLDPLASYAPAWEGVV